MSEKIQNNFSFVEFEKDIEGIKTIKKIASFLSPISKTAKNVLKSFEGFNDMEKQFKEISRSPDVFNNLFSDLGWIAHESMNHELMLECIELAKKENIDLAEEKLADYYTSEKIQYLIPQLKSIDAFKKRYKLMLFAYEDTISKRFYAAIPVILMIIDGGVNDIDKNKGFFTETTDLTAWDSIAGHSTGLSKLRDILNIGRNGSNEEEIFLPYRNGILHGRDISYNNKYVAGKCWATLIAIGDWAKAKNTKIPKEEKKLTLSESIKDLNNTISNYQEHKKRIDEIDNYVKNWQPRNIIIGIDISKNGEIDNYTDFTPEKDAVKFITNWKNKNYGAIAKQINYFSKEINFNKEAGRVRKIFENKILKEFKIIRIVDCAPAISEVYLNVIVEYEKQNFRFEIKLRMIYQDNNGNNLVFGQKNGEWKFIDSCFFHKIEFLNLY